MNRAAQAAMRQDAIDDHIAIHLKIKELFYMITENQLEYIQKMKGR